MEHVVLSQRGLIFFVRRISQLVHDISTGDKGWCSSELAVDVQLLFCPISVPNSLNSVLNVQQDVISVASTGGVTDHDPK